MDGIGGTVCLGTGYYLNKKALYGSPNQQGMHIFLRSAQVSGMYRQLSHNTITNFSYFFFFFFFFFGFADEFLLERQKNFGLSSKFINSLEGKNEESINTDGISSDGILEEARILASCAFEENTKWGKEASILLSLSYHSSHIGYYYNIN